MSLEDIPHCDIYYPTTQEFSNFEEYVSKIEKIAKSGIVKVNLSKN
jgi:hypothetical protein